MSITDQQVLSEIQSLLIEPVDGGVTWASGLWTTSEVIGYLNQRQRRFLDETEVVVKHSSDIANIPNTLRHALPSDWISTSRVVFKDPLGNYYEVPRADEFQLDMSLLSWGVEQASKPIAYADNMGPTLEFEAAPATSSPGVFQMLYTYLTSALSNSGISLTVPDEFEPAIRWGVIADMLNKEGREQDLERAQYAELRFQEGIQAAKVMLSGWI